MNQHTYCLITSSVVVELSLAQFDYIQCAESGLAPHSGFEPWPEDRVSHSLFSEGGEWSPPLGGGLKGGESVR